MIVSVHLPKTAGKSFAAALRACFGESLLEDYASLPMNTPEEVRNRAALDYGLSNAENDFLGIECIHGHFLPVKYSLLPARRPVTFVTWVRHPVQRILSNYYYWRRSYEPATSPPLHRRVVEEDWSIERFCLCQEMRNMYRQFLWGFPVERFDFIGVTEFYDEDLAYFARHYLPRAVEAQRLNVGDASGREYDLDDTLRRRIETFHEGDMKIYQGALQKRRARHGG